MKKTSMLTSLVRVFMLVLSLMLLGFNAKATNYISDIMIGSDKDATIATSLLTNNGFTICTGDMAQGLGEGSYYVVMGCKTSTNKTDAITGIVIVSGEGYKYDKYLEGNGNPIVIGGKNYYLAKHQGGTGDLNQGGGGNYLYVYYTRDGNSTAANCITSISTSNNSANCNVLMGWSNDCANLNSGTGEKTPNIYMHITRHSHSWSNGFCDCDEFLPATDADNDGSYEIANAGQLYWFANLVNSGTTNAKAILTDNIVVNSNVLKEDGTINATDSTSFRDWTPIGGNESTQYTGNFSGKGYTVSGLYFNNSETQYVGLFGVNAGTIDSVGVVASYFNGNVGVAGLCGLNTGSISNGYSMCSVYGDVVVSGICGMNTGTLRNCFNTGLVNSSGDFVGGVCALNNKGTIINCYNAGSVSGSENYVGGVCGANKDSVINCYNTGRVNGSYNYIGSVYGYSDGTIGNCYYLTSESNGSDAKTAAQFASGEVAYLLGHGDVDGSIWGQKLPTDTIPVLGGEKVSATRKYCDGIPVAYCNDCEFDETIVHTYVNGFCSRCDGYEPSTKNSDDVYKIANAGQLYWFANLVNSGTTDANAILTDNIVVNSNVLNEDGSLNGDGSNFRSWTPIGNVSQQYTGTFNGNGHSISGLYFNDTNNNSSEIGLIGFSMRATIEGVGIEDSYFAAYAFVGGLSGTSVLTSFKNCYNTSTLYALGPVGGICGSTPSCTYSGCFNTGKLSSGGSVGGLGGMCQGTVESVSNCYYLEQTGLASVQIGEIKTGDQFKSGEVAYLLSHNGADGSVWGQNLDTDTIPVFSTSTVYRYLYCSGKADYSNDESTEGVQDHDYASEYIVDVDPTCTTAGSQSRHCTRCDAKTDVTEIVAKGHDWGEWYTTVVATCDETGSRTHTCKNDAAHQETETIDALGHDYADDYTIDAKPTCTTVGFQSRHCTRCEAKTDVTEIAALGHDYADDYTIDVAPTCTTAGLQSRHCTRCEAVTDVTEITALGHDLYTSFSSIDCESPYVERRCTRCSYRDFEYFTPTSHNYQFLSSDVDPTCTEPGRSIYVCTRCNDQEYREIPALGHAWNEWVKTMDPTCTETGSRYHICNRDESHKETEVIDALGHDYSNGFCSRCDAYEPAYYNEEADIYEIGNVGQLYWFAGLVNGDSKVCTGDVVQNTSANAILTADINVNDTTGWKSWATIAPTRSWTPIGKNSKAYIGTFNGKGHTVSGLYFNNEDSNSVGLIGNNSGTIEMVGVLSSYFLGSSEIGGVCGHNEGTIKCCYNTGNVNGYDVVGCVCGSNYGTISSCYNTGRLDCVLGTYGGVCGANNSAGSISNCYSANDVMAVGYAYGNIENVSVMTSEQFASGEVAYLLQQDLDKQVWGQNLGENADKHPIFNDNRVYRYIHCNGDMTYSNDASLEKEETHNYYNGFCVNERNGKKCDVYEPASYNEETATYQIGNAGQLYWFAGLVNGDSKVCTGDIMQNTSANAILTADITVNDTTGWSSWNNETVGLRTWTPIGYLYQYNGTFNGAGHTISGLYCNNDDPYPAGLIGNNSGTIEMVGVLSSYFLESSVIGGVCGNNEGTIKCCYNTGNVNGNTNVGGVCGNNNGTISSCYNTGRLDSNGGDYRYGNYGGVCGSNIGTISNCYSSNEEVVGSFWGTLDNVSVMTSEQFASGEVAYLLQQDLDEQVWGQNLGENADKQPTFSGAKVYKNCDPEVNDYSNEIKHYYHNGFCVCCDNYEPAYYSEETDTYEIGNAGQLYWFAGLVNGDGKVCTGDVMQNTSANAILTADISVNDTIGWTSWNNEPVDLRTWTPIGYPYYYNGTFNGTGHTISGLYCNNDAYPIGLIGENSGTIESVGVLASYFSGDNYVGGVCGSNHGTLTNCYNTGSVSGDGNNSRIGGVCGSNYGQNLTNCYNTGSVSGDGNNSRIGGVCGENFLNPITNCYNTGSVSGDGSNYVGGVIGYNEYATVSNCYCNGETLIGIDDGITTNCLTKSAAQFASGEMALLLQKYVDENNSDGSLANWTQTIGDDSPSFGDGGIDYAREKSDIRWGSLCLPYAISSANASFFTVAKKDGDMLILKPIDEVEAGKPVIYYCTDDSLKVTMADFGADALAKSPLNEDFLVGSYVVDTIAADNSFYLKDNKFYSCNGSFVVNPYKAYIQMSDENSANQVLRFNLNGHTTPVDAVAEEASATDGTTADVNIEAIYNIKGQRVAGMQKNGIYLLKMSDGSTQKAVVR